MGERVEALARQFERMNDDLIAVIEGCPEERWSARCPDTGWPVNVQAHHIAGGLALFPPMLAAIADGAPVPPPADRRQDARSQCGVHLLVRVYHDPPLRGILRRLVRQDTGSRGAQIRHRENEHQLDHPHPHLRHLSRGDAEG